MKSENSIVPIDVITSKIYLIRGQKVMLDRDLAELYDVKNIRLRRTSKKKYKEVSRAFYV